MTKFISISAIFLFLLFAACSKKDKVAVASKTELLTSGSWKPSAVVLDDDGNGSYETDVYAGFSDCFKDNYWTFKTNGALELNEGPTKCDPIDPQIEAGTWRLTQNETHLAINSDEWILQELTASTLKWKEEYSGGRSSLVTFTKR
jgi:hypothetical protein